MKNEKLNQEELITKGEKLKHEKWKSYNLNKMQQNFINFRFEREIIPGKKVISIIEISWFFSYQL